MGNAQMAYDEEIVVDAEKVFDLLRECQPGTGQSDELWVTPTDRLCVDCEEPMLVGEVVRASWSKGPSKCLACSMPWP